jgi:hypothetical protein
MRIITHQPTEGIAQARMHSVQSRSRPTVDWGRSFKASSDDPGARVFHPRLGG